jgi:hypothetical protein
MSHFSGHFEGASVPQFLKQRDINSYYSIKKNDKSPLRWEIVAKYTILFLPFHLDIASEFFKILF